MTNARKITCLVVGCLWMLTPIVALLIDEWATGHRMSLYMYIFLGTIFVLLGYLFYGIWHSIDKIDQLEKKKEEFESGTGKTEDAAEAVSVSSGGGSGPFDPFASEYADFAERLRALVPSITGSEEKLCILIRAKKRNKEIAQILHIDENSVYTQRYRIKRKLPLPEGVTMDEWIKQVE